MCLIVWLLAVPAIALDPVQAPFPNLGIASTLALEPCGKLIEDPGRAPLTQIALKGMG